MIGMKQLLLSIVYFISTVAIAQPYNPEKVNKKAVSLFNLARQRAEDGSLTNAAGLLVQAIDIDSKYVDAFLALASIQGKLKNYPTSITNYEKAFLLDSNYTLDYKPLYASRLAGIGSFDKALDAINEYLEKKNPANQAAADKIQKLKKNYEFAVSYAKEHPDTSYVFVPKNMGANVNSAMPEYLPSLTIDGNELVFTRRVNNSNEDFYFSKKNKTGWENARAATGAINTPQSEAAQTLSADGEWMIYSAQGRKDSYGNYDLYMAQLTPKGWEDTYHFGGKINTDQWESQPCLSPGNKDLYFASRRPGGFGGIDIYVSRLQANGYYSEPENLGPNINTAGDDQCPFIHADNQTLYFTSNYWPGYGDDDLFVSRKQPDGQWGKPQNLGYPINTVEKEGTLFVAADGKTAYYASDRADSKGNLDIYTFDLPERSQPIKTLWVRGKVFDKKTGIGVASAVELFDMATKQPVTIGQTDEKGNYFITLPVGKDYVFNVNRKGYLFWSDNFFMASNPSDSTYKKDIALLPIEKNASIVMKNIFFDVNKSELKPESQTELNKLIQFLNDNPTLKIEISGHTDNSGKPADNLELSNNRAKAVVNYLISKKISPFRLLFKGYGETKPLGDNKTEEGRALNRRTEMKIISQ